ncbi:MAG: hypothetical protein Q8K45_03750, partial [Rubrivivax sp.]|nr:hypothetical protein [Rubrivivax sp.]
MSSRHRPLLPRSLFATAALAAMAALAACGGNDDDPSPFEQTPRALTLEKIGGFDGGVVGAA